MAVGVVEPLPDVALRRQMVAPRDGAEGEVVEHVRKVVLELRRTDAFEDVLQDRRGGRPVPQERGSPDDDLGLDRRIGVAETLGGGCGLPAGSGGGGQVVEHEVDMRERGERRRGLRAARRPDELDSPLGRRARLVEEAAAGEPRHQMGGGAGLPEGVAVLTVEVDRGVEVGDRPPP